MFKAWKIDAEGTEKKVLSIAHSLFSPQQWEIYSHYNSKPSRIYRTAIFLLGFLNQNVHI